MKTKGYLLQAAKAQFPPVGWQDVYKPQCCHKLYHRAVLKGKYPPLSSTLWFELQPRLISPHLSYPLIFHQRPLSSSSSCSSSLVLHCASLTQNCDVSFSFWGAVYLFSPQIHCPQSCWWLSCLHEKSLFPAQKRWVPWEALSWSFSCACVSLSRYSKSPLLSAQSPGKNLMMFSPAPFSFSFAFCAIASFVSSCATSLFFSVCVTRGQFAFPGEISSSHS